MFSAMLRNLVFSVVLVSIMVVTNGQEEQQDQSSLPAAATTTTKSVVTTSEETESVETTTTMATTTASAVVTVPSDVANNDGGLSDRQSKKLRPDGSDGPCVCGDTSACPARRTVPTSKCPCRTMCARQTGQSCSEDEPCDADFGLECSAGTCKGKLMIERSEVTYNSMTLRWKMRTHPVPLPGVFYTPNYAGSDTHWTKAESGDSIVTIHNLRPNTDYVVRVMQDGTQELMVVRTKDGCDVNGTIYNLGETYHVECLQTCTCLQGGKSDCRDRCTFRPGAITDPSCEEVPDMEDSCCVMYKCKDSSPSVAPKVLVTNRTPSTLTVAWDDFKSPSYQTGYVVEYRPKTLAQDFDHWERIQSDNMPQTTLEHLKPHTAYQIKVSVWEDKEVDKLGISSEVLTIFTADGCVRGNNTYSVGEEFLEGCELRCVCRSNNEGDCKERCVEPFVKAGTMPFDPLCYEKPIPEDPCCVSVLCAQSKTEEAEGSYAEKHGECPEIVEDQSTDPDSCSSECHYDFECSGRLKCCPSSCGGAVCVEVFPKIDCENTVCGKNAYCVVENQLPTCRCHKGYSGDPNDLTAGCDQGLPLDRKIDMCIYKNQTYPVGEMFTDDCDLKCHCTDKYEVECQQRCIFRVEDMSNKDPNCQILEDPQDPCCKTLACETGNISNVQNVSAPSVFFENKTMASDTTESPVEAMTLPPVNDTTQFPTESDDLETTIIYEQQTVTEKVLIDTGRTTVVDLDFGSVITTTENPVHSSHAEGKGKARKSDSCEFGGKIYEAREEFYDGCEARCVCGGKGHLSCVPRCSLVTSGGDSCKEVPDPNDSCCHILVCSPPGDMHTVTKVDDLRIRIDMAEVQNATTVKIKWSMVQDSKTAPLSEDTVIQVWYAVAGNNSDGSDTLWMKQKYKLSDMTAVHPGMYELLIGNLQPETEYYLKVLKPPTGKDEKEDPNAEFDTVSNTVKVKMFSSVAGDTTPMCEYNGQFYNMNEEFYNGCLEVCHCGANLRVNCAIIECPHHFNHHFTECLEWDIDPNFQAKPPNCCPPSKCKNDGSCTFNGLKFRNFQQIPQEMLDCGKRCVCVNGNVSCENRCPPSNSSPPPTLPCPPSMAYRGYLPGDECCTHWMCRETEKPAHCTFQGKQYKLQEQWEVRKGTQRRLCTCKLLPSGEAEVECNGGCPPIPLRFQRPNPQCPRPVLITPSDPVVCPYIVCSDAQSGKELQNVSVVAVNSTAIRVRFTLASVLVGLVGHAELHYTTDPSLPVESWGTQKFARPKRLFDTPNIEYYLANLLPDTTYFFQIQIIIDALHSGPQSEVYKLRMPPEPTTTTTVPPLLMLDLMMTSENVNPNTIKVMWRPLDSREKKYVDGLKIKYKANGHEDGEWQMTPVIHRDRTFYYLRDLEPSASYLIDMDFMVPDGLPTKVTSAKPMEIKTMEPPKDEFLFDILMKVESTDIYTAQLSVMGIPEPLSKFLHVVRVMYKSDDEAEQTQVFKVLKEPKITLDSLKPGHRYKVWIDAYLTNGKTMSSNVLELHTKAGPPPTSTTESNEIDDNKPVALHSMQTDRDSEAYYIALIVVAIVAAVAGLGFIVLLVLLLKKQSKAKAPITRNPSESAYDNPTYKTYDGERVEEKNGSVQA